tara:strand:+ start:693 stop:875 length:183 start_codon:yes stop_codon:yes gene_type:complete
LGDVLAAAAKAPTLEGSKASFPSGVEAKPSSFAVLATMVAAAAATANEASEIPQRGGTAA